MMNLYQGETRKLFAKDGTAPTVILGNLQYYGNDLWRNLNAL